MSGHVVIAPDKFKGSLTAAQAADRIAAGLRRVDPGVDLVVVPVADGGDGLLDAAVAIGFSTRLVEVSGPTGEPIPASFGVRGTTAVVELAEASGLRRLPGGRLEPLPSSSRGTGDLMRAALDAGCTEIVLGLGGSACTDGGAGLLAALGARITDAEGTPVPPGGGGLAQVADVDLTGLDPRLKAVDLLVAGDVDNPLHGPNGAAAVYGPQKGADAADVAFLAGALRRWSDAVTRATGSDGSALPGAGAAGGTGFAALAVLGARCRRGIDVVLELADFDTVLAGARLVVTGEGSLDGQSLHGKTPVGVAEAAAARGVPTVAVVGRRVLTAEQAQAAGFTAVHSLGDLESDPGTCMSQAGPLLEELVATRIASMPPTAR